MPKCGLLWQTVDVGALRGLHSAGEIEVQHGRVEMRVGNLDA